MSELGQHLKEVREQKQISLDDLQRTTKIQKRYLIAIEEGRFESLPGLFYARAFVKTYAESIGLDSEPLFEKYRNELPNPEREAQVLPSRSERSRSTSSPKKRKKGSPVLSALIAVVFIAIIVVAIWIIVQNVSRGDDGAITPDENQDLVEADFDENVGVIEDEDVNEETDETQEEADLEDPLSEEVEEETETEPLPVINFIESSGITSYFEMENGRLENVQIEFTGPSYVDVKNEKGKTFFSGQRDEGEERLELGAEERVIFNFGASQNISLFVNDEQIELPLEIVHQKIDIKVVLDE